MKLSVSSLDINNPWSFVIVYGLKDRKTLTSLKKIKAFKKSREFVEPLFHERDHEKLMTRLVSHQFVPPWATGLPPLQFLNNQTTFTPENFVSLEPFGGSVNYSIGIRKTASGGQGPRLWVEQDSFVIRKIRLGSKVEFVNNSFRNFYPRAETALQTEYQLGKWNGPNHSPQSGEGKNKEKGLAYKGTGKGSSPHRQSH